MKCMEGVDFVVRLCAVCRPDRRNAVNAVTSEEGLDQIISQR